MATKDKQRWLVIPNDVLKYSNLNTSIPLGFFITEDTRVIIAPMEYATDEFDEDDEPIYEFLAKCTIDSRNGFNLPENVDNYLGSGDTYSFSAYKSKPYIYIYKLNELSIEVRNY